MQQPLENLPNTAQAWIFPSYTRLSAHHQSVLKEELGTFLEAWQAHGEALYAHLYIEPYQLVLFVDTQKAVPSGCALDAWHKALQHCTKHLQINCFEYEQILCRSQQDWRVYAPSEALRAWKTGELTDETLIADVRVGTKEAFFGETRFLPLRKSWLAARA